MTNPWRPIDEYGRRRQSSEMDHPKMMDQLPPCDSMIVAHLNNFEVYLWGWLCVIDGCNPSLLSTSVQLGSSSNPVHQISTNGILTMSNILCIIRPGGTKNNHLANSNMKVGEGFQCSIQDQINNRTSLNISFF